MRRKDFDKMANAARRAITRDFGFRQSSYVNFKVAKDYFFGLEFLVKDAILIVKPMYADDLWWDVFDMSDNKKAPLSLRSMGAFALSGQVLGRYRELDPKLEYTPEEMEQTYREVFTQANADIEHFFEQAPDAEDFFPDESQMYYDPDRLLYIMALLRHARYDEVLSLIAEARANHFRCMYQSSVRDDDSYSYIARWCRAQQEGRH